MKRIIAMLLVAACLFSMTACLEQPHSAETEDDRETIESIKTEPTEESTLESTSSTEESVSSESEPSDTEPAETNPPVTKPTEPSLRPTEPETEPTQPSAEPTEPAATEPVHIHTWENATCTNPKTCTTCGATEGSANGHDWMAATCNEPKTCNSCGATEGTVLTHNYVGGTCSHCGLIYSNFTIPSSGYDGSEVTITFYHTMGTMLSEVLNCYIDEFNKLYPNITIKHSSLGGWSDFDDQINAEIAAGNQPNIAYCYPEHVAGYLQFDSLVNLDGLIGSTIEYTDYWGQTETIGLNSSQIADFIPSLLEEGRQYGDGLMYTLPLFKSTEVLYYDKTFFEQNNLSVPTTWEEMEAICEMILQIDPNCIPLGYDSESNWFINMCAQYGSGYTSATGDHYLFDNATNRDFVTRFRQWYQKGYCTTQEIYGAYTSSLFTAEGGTRCYMSIGSSAGARYQLPGKDYNTGEYPFEVGIASIPQYDGTRPKVLTQGPSLCLFQSENTQEVIASWLFMKYLTTNVEFQAEFSMASGYMPVIQSVVSNPYYSSFLSSADGYDHINAQAIQVCLSQANAYFTAPGFVGSATAKEIVGNLLVDALTFEDSGDTAAYIKKLFKQAVKDCAAYDIPSADEPISDPGLESARNFLYVLYCGVDYETPNDYMLRDLLQRGSEKYTVEWSVDSNQIQLVSDLYHQITVCIPKDNTDDIYYTLTAKICNSSGESTNISFEHFIPAPTAIPTELKNGTYVISWNGLTFSTLPEDRSYGYPGYNEVTVAGGTVIGYTDMDVMYISNVEGGFVIQDAYGRYVYLKGTYNSFNLDYQMPAEGHIWQLLVSKDGTYVIVNKMNAKTLAFDTRYSSWGAYPELGDTQMAELIVVEVAAP